MQRSASRLRRVLAMVVVSSLACGSSSAPSQPAPGSAAPPPPAPAAAPTPVPAAAPAPPRTCAADADCNFAEGVQPARCVVGPAPAAGKEPAKPDGGCVCLAGACALRPNGARVSQRGCDRAMDDCALEIATARCEPGQRSSDAPRGLSYGPSCACDRGDQRCHLRWYEPVACRTTDDCWSSDEPVAHAIPRPPRLRGREFRGCVDGEHVPACVQGRCTLETLTC